VSCSKTTNKMKNPSNKMTTELIDISSNKLTATNVNVTDVTYLGEKATKVKLTDAYQQKLVDAFKAKKHINPNAHAALPIDLFIGEVEFDMAIEINEFANPFSRGFGGLAFRLQEDNETYEAIYTRGTNGLLNKPLPEATQVTHGIQYVSEPKQNFAFLRTNYPEIYEKPASISINTWHHYKFVIKENSVSVFIDNAPTPSITSDDQFAIKTTGKLALWLGPATNTYFKNFKITK
ncbi:MAG: hypothetical protein ACPG4W_04720, partial [Flavobacteriales bacterium]